jgi:two-component system alkaline phosphatase synthesis response regulator PhoP
MPRVLLVEDEPGMVVALTDRLVAAGYEVDSATDGETGLERASRVVYDLIVLDVMLPRKDGFEVCRELRRSGVSAGIVMLTAKDRIADKVAGLKFGADDYLTKPFATSELLARMEALLRRLEPSSDVSETFEFGSVRVNFRSAEVHRNGSLVKLSARELSLLRYFIDHRGTVLSRNELLDHVWGYDFIPTTRTVDTHVSWLRQKLEPDPHKPRYIITVHGLGYRFDG